MEKSPDAFRTISEVADLLQTPAHVLRFWETRFPQVRPVKRAGGRRYYRPGDVALLAGIRRLLHDEGMTIRGVQKVLREQGIRHVAGLSDGDLAVPEVTETADSIEAQLAAALGPVPDPVQEAPETAQIIALEAVLAQKDAARAAEEKPSMRRDLFDLDAAPEQGSTPPAPIIALTPPAPQPPEIPVESTQSTARGQMAARLRQAQRAGGLPQPEVLLPLSARLAALRDRLAEGTRKRPR